MRKKKKIPFCKLHNRRMVATRYICPQCLGGITSPARREAALTASKAAAEARKKRKRLAAKPEQKRGRYNAEVLDEVFS